MSKGFRSADETQALSDQGQIVGEVPALSAVSIGWGEDPGQAREAIEQEAEKPGTTVFEFVGRAPWIVPLR